MNACGEKEYPCLGLDRMTAEASFTCIPIEKRCDGSNDCKDWSDEENCCKLIYKNENLRILPVVSAITSFNNEGYIPYNVAKMIRWYYRTLNSHYS